MSLYRSFLVFISCASCVKPFYKTMEFFSPNFSNLLSILETIYGETNKIRLEEKFPFWAIEYPKGSFANLYSAYSC